MKDIRRDVLGAVDIFSVAIDVALVMALFPTIKGFINAASENMTATEVAISALVPLILVLALVYALAVQTGLLKHKK